MLLTPLVLLNLLSVGTVMSDQLAEIAKLLPLDTSFHRPHRHLGVLRCSRCRRNC